MPKSCKDKKFYQNNFNELYEHNFKKNFRRSEKGTVIGVHDENLTLYSRGSMLSVINLSPDGGISLSISLPDSPESPLSFLELTPSGIKGNAMECISVKGALPTTTHFPTNMPPVVNPYAGGSKPAGLTSNAIQNLRECFLDQTFRENEESISVITVKDKPLSGSYKLGERDYLDNDITKIPIFVNKPAIDYVLTKIGEKINNQELVDEIREKSQYVCYLDPQGIAGILSAELINPEFLLELYENLAEYINIDGLVINIVTFIMSLINTYLSIVFWLDDYSISPEEQKILDVLQEVSYFNLDSETQKGIDYLENKFIDDFLDFLADFTDEQTRMLPNFFAFLSGGCLNTSQEIINFFSKSLDNKYFIELLTKDVEMFAADETLVRDVIREVQNHWNGSEILEKIKEAMKIVSDEYKGQMKNLMTNLVDDLMFALEPFRRVMDFMEAGVPGGEIFLKTLGKMLGCGISTIPFLIQPINRAIDEAVNHAYLKANILAEELDNAEYEVESLKSEKERLEEQVKANEKIAKEANENANGIDELEKETEELSNENWEDNFPDFWDEIAELSDSTREEVLPKVQGGKNNSKLLKSENPENGEVWFYNKELDLNESNESNESNVLTINQIKYFTGLLDPYRVGKETLASVLVRARKSFNCETNSCLMKKFKEMVVEHDFGNVFGRRISYESLKEVKERSILTNTVHQNNIDKDLEELDEIENKLNDSLDKLKEAEIEYEKIGKDIQQKKRDLITLDEAKGECSALNFFSDLTKATASTIAKLPAELTTDMVTFLVELVSAVPLGPGAVKKKIVESDIFKSVVDGPIKPAIDKLLEQMENQRIEDESNKSPQTKQIKQECGDGNHFSF